MNKWIKPYLKKYKGQISLTILFGFLGIVSGAMLLFVSGYLISKSSLQPVNILIVYVPIVAVRTFSIAQAVFPYLEKLLGHNVVLRILASLRERLYSILESQTFNMKLKYQTGDILGVLSDDIERLQDFYIKTAFPSIIGLVIYTLFVVVIGAFDLIFMVLMMLVLGVILFLMPYLSYKKNKVNFTQLKQQKNQMYRHLTDGVYGQVDWLASGRKNEVINDFNSRNNDLVYVEKNIQRWRHFKEIVLRIAASTAIILMLFWSNIQTGEGSITATLIAAFVLMTFTITDALIPVSEAVEEIPTYVDSIKRMDEIEGTSEIIEREKMNFPKELKNTEVILKDVSFSYENENNKAINQLNLVVAPGEKLAILGKSGTGKSTLLKLISGVLKPNTGVVQINGLEMSADYLSEAVAVLNQKPHLFNTSILNNIKIARPNATDEEVNNVIEQAQLTKLIQKLPKGLNTNVEEMGSRFSGGERQRIAFARILLQDTPIIIMDEPTIGLDPITEKELLETLIYGAKDKTVIWVTHHLAGAEMMDKVMFLEDGKIKMYGSHQDLLQSNSYYKTLYQMDDGVFYAN